MQTPKSASEHYRDQQRITALTVLAAGNLWGSTPPEDFDAWFEANAATLVALTSAGQARAVRGSGDYVSRALGEIDAERDPEASVDPSQLVGVASDGRPLDSLLYGSVISAKAAIAKADEVDDHVVRDAWSKGRTALEQRVLTQIADAERSSTMLEISVRPGVGYTRLVRAGGCSRCTILAGRFYRWSDGFLRHPRCMCRHIPTTESASADLISDPRDAFWELPIAWQDKIYTRAGADAIREGADMAQVVNVRRGNSGLQTGAGEITTTNVYGEDLFISTEGTTKRGFAGKLIRSRGQSPATTPRLMPESIAKIAESREDYLHLLELNGYAFDRTKPNSRGSLTGTPTKPAPKPKPKPAPKPPTVDLDAIQAKIELETQSKLAAEAARPLSTATRELIVAAKASLPQGESGWNALTTLRKDPRGELLPSKELSEHLATVKKAGRAIRADIARRVDIDVEIAALRAEMALGEKKFDDAKGAGNLLNAVRARDALVPIQGRIAKRESDLIREALADVREFGGHEQSVRALSPSDRSTLSGIARRDVRAVDADATALLREAERYYPTAWLQAADARGPVGLGYVDRGFFLKKSTLSTDTITISQRGASRYIAGAHSDAETETMIHELGHRMEESIPGLKALEFALVRARATHGGVLEDLTVISPSTPGEVTYKDQWTISYAGRSYVPQGYSRPDTIAHEVFQVGTQDLFGRSAEKYGDDELQEFMMGVLALL